MRFNDGVFPNNRALTENGFIALEEERRLAYVAMTRAKEKLYLTFSSDYSYVIGGSLKPSQFITESGNLVLRESTYNLGGGLRPNTTRMNSSRYTFDDGDHLSFERQDEPKNQKQDFAEKTNGLSENDWHVGDIVIHKRLGKGYVVALEGDGIIKVDFEEHGIKSIMGNHPMVGKGN